MKIENANRDMLRISCVAIDPTVMYLDRSLKFGRCQGQPAWEIYANNFRGPSQRWSLGNLLYSALLHGVIKFIHAEG